MPDLKQHLRDIQECNLHAISSMRDEAVHLFETQTDLEPKVFMTLRSLFSYLFSRCQTISFLLSAGYDWDAEIILRSFYETSIKIIYICSADSEERLILVDEFWDGLGPIGDRKNASRASFAQDLFDEGISSAILEALQNKEVFDLERQGNKQSRKRLEQKWSFAEIVSALEARSLKGKPLRGIKSLLHIYGISSHLIHSDKFALDLMHDRAIRPAEELMYLKSGHVARMMSDQVNLLWLCIENFRELISGRFLDEPKLSEARRKFSIASDLLTNLFEESQREFYRK